MPRVFIEGFEAGQLDLWDSQNGIGSLGFVAAPAGMSGSYALSVTQLSITKNLPAADYYYAAVKIKPIGSTSDSALISFLNNATVLGSLYLIAGTYVLSAYRGDKSALLASYVNPLVAGVVYLIEVYYKPHASAGFFQVKVNGAMAINNNGNTTAASLQINAMQMGAGYPGIVYDDIVIDNADWIGNTFIQGVFPSNVGNSSQFTPSVGSNYSCVDEVPASDTDYVATNAVDQLDTYTHTALAGAAHVLCVQVQARAVQEGAPTPLNLKAALRSVGVDYLGTNSLVPTTNYKALSYVWQTNPLDGSPWTPAIVNATEIGMKSAT